MEFKQKQIQQIPLDDLAAEKFLALAIEATRQLGWIFGDINSAGFTAYTNNGFFSWNAEIKLKVSNETATIQSQSIGDEVIDVIENKKNIQKFISAFKNLENNSKTETPAIYGSFKTRIA